MKNITLILILILSTLSGMAQAPDKMSYQAIVRNSDNDLLINQSIGIQISLIEGSTNGSAVYVETQNPTTNSNGLISIEIGTGNTITGTFNTIDWGNNTYFIKTEIDPTGGNSYTITGVSQLMSVPYALYAKTSGSSTPGPMGETGPQGPAGVDGADGATGPIGPQGPAGADGADGATGPVGPQGPQGPAGPAGADGADGATGPIGPQGPAGADGADGATGPVGPQGPAGADGATGPIGPQGPAGADGVDGATGPVGPQGPQGPAGPAGADGADGATGPIGPQGPAGADGGNYTITVVNSNTTITSVSQIVISTGTMTLTLPATPQEGQVVYIYHEGNTSLNANGKNLKASGSTISTPLTLNGSAVQIVYSGGTWYAL